MNFRHLNLYIDLIPIQFEGPDLNMFTNRLNRYTDFRKKNFVQKKNFIPKNSKKFSTKKFE